MVDCDSNSEAEAGVEGFPGVSHSLRDEGSVPEQRSVICRSPAKGILLLY